MKNSEISIHALFTGAVDFGILIASGVVFYLMLEHAIREILKGHYLYGPTMILVSVVLFFVMVWISFLPW